MSISTGVFYGDGTSLPNQIDTSLSQSGSVSYFAEAYNAKGDGKQLLDAAIASTSHTLVSASAPFVAGDVGKTIQINGAGAAGIALITTISGFTSATTVTLTAAAGTTTTSASAYYGTDDAAAIQAAVNVIVAAGGGTVQFQAKIYIVGTSIKFPAVDLSTGKLVPLAFEGAMQPPWSFNELGANQMSIGGTILMATSGTAFDATSAVYSSVFVSIRHLLVRTRDNPTTTAVNLYYAAMARVDMAIDTGIPSNSQSYPTTVNTFGLQTPAKDNGGSTIIDNIFVTGYRIGVQMNEHAVLVDGFIYQCFAGLSFEATNHDSHVIRISISACTYNINFNGQHFVKFDDLDIENLVGGTWGTIADVNDPSNFGNGIIYWHVVRGFVGPIRKLIVVGGANLTRIPLYSKSRSISRQLTDYSLLVQDLNPIDYWPMGDAAGSTVMLSQVMGTNGVHAGSYTAGTAGALSMDDATCVLYGASAAASTAVVDLSAYRTVWLTFWMWWDAFSNNDLLAFEFSVNYNNNVGTFIVDPNSTNGSASKFTISTHGNVGGDAAQFTRPSAAAWHHYAFKFDTTAGAGHQAVPYVDGVLQSYTSDSTAANTNNFGSFTLYFMSRSGVTLYGLGRLQHVALFPSLTQGQINRLATWCK